MLQKVLLFFIISYHKGLNAGKDELKCPEYLFPSPSVATLILQFLLHQELMWYVDPQFIFPVNYQELNMVRAQHLSLTED